jgi:DNA-binding response OmpR family regulator
MPESARAVTVSSAMTTQTLEILVCDDESSLREALRQSFQRAGHRVQAVADGRSAIDRASTQHFDVVLLDVALGPGSPDGYEVCRELRARRNPVAVIMLTALDSEADAVLGLEAGADDYVVKPFRPAELRSRIRAVLRRTGSGDRGGSPLRAGPLVLDPGRREVQRDGEPVDITFSEFEILHALMARRERVHSRHELLRAIWGDSAYRDPRSIDVHVRHLREKLETTPEEPQLILTVRGAGYRIGEP